MIVVVTGSRSLVKHDDREVIKYRFYETINSLNPTALFHGGASGPDTWAAREFSTVAVNVRPAYDAPDPIKALFDRNKVMVNKAMHWAALAEEELTMVSCWDGQSRGTRDAMEYAMQVGIKILDVLEKLEVG